MKKLTGIVLGALLISCGVLYILGILGIAEFQFSLNGWWTLFIILPCLNGLLTEQDKTGNLLGLAVGVLLLLAARGVFAYGVVWKLIVPLIIVALGIWLIVHSLPSADERNPAPGDALISVFDKQSVDYTGKELDTARIGAIFGGTECNLTNAKIVDGSRILLFCAFGGVDLTLPEKVIVKNNAFCLFGGISDERGKQKVAQGDVVLSIEGYCLFGGVEIK